MPSITQLEYLLAVERTGHFGKAAKVCHVSQPTLSMQIQKLETDLQVVIFDRSRKPITATTLGRRLIEQARLVVRESHRFAEIAQEDEADLAGDFRLAIIPTLSPYLLPRFIRDLSRRCPKVNFQIEEHQTESIVAALDREELDAGILVTPLKIPGLFEVPVFYEPFYLYVRKDHPLAKYSQITEDDLEGREMWLLAEGHCLRNQVVRACSGRKGRSVLKNVNFESGSLETLKHLVEAGDGITIVPELSILERAHVPPTIAVIPFKRPIPAREVSIVYRRKVLKLKIVEMLEDCITQALPPNLRALRKRDLEVLKI